MSELVLRQLAVRDELDVQTAVEEFEAEGGQWSYQYPPRVPWSEHVDAVHGWQEGIGLPAGFVPHADLVAEVNGVIVGRGSVRYELNEFLRTLGGHIGYAVRPRFRGRGYATEILRQALTHAWAHGIDPVLVTCDDDNLASRRVIEKVGGELDDVVVSFPDSPRKRRYWFPKAR